MAFKSSIPIAAAILTVALTGPVAVAHAHTKPTTSAGTAAWAGVRIPRYQHITVIADVSHDFGAIFHNKFAPVINRLAHRYGLASRYFTTSDPDVANIVAMLAGNSFGVNDSFPYWDEQIHKRSLLSELDAKGMTWKAYYQGLPYPGYLGACYPVRCNGTPDADTFFTYKHEGVANFASVAGNPAEARKMVPATELATDARRGRLPNFSLVIPDECDDMHGGPPWCEDGTSSYHQPNDNHLVAGADAYIGQVARQIMSGPQWRRGNNALVITFTEGDTSAGCCGAKPGTGRVMTVVVTSHGPRGLVDSTPYNHYSLLATIQHALGVPCLQHTCDARQVIPMARLFGGTASAATLLSKSQDSKRSAGPAATVRDAAGRPGGAAAKSPWVQVASPNLGQNDNSLGAVAGRSASDIWAVGDYLPASHPDVTSTLAVHYDGHSWRHVPTPNVGTGLNQLLGVTALPDGTAWAVGDFVTAGGRTSKTLIEHWNGHRWSVVPSPNPSGQENLLYSVVATGDRSAWAVGAELGRSGAFLALAEHWNGHRWRAVPCRQPGSAGDFLYSVTTIGRRVFASGQEFTDAAPDRQLVMRLTSSGGFALKDLPRAQAFGAVASVSPFAIAGSPDGLWLAGSARSGSRGYQTFVERLLATSGRDGQQASKNPTPQDNYLWSIAPIGSGVTAWAVGNDIVHPSGTFDSLIEFGSASAGWTIVPSPNPGLASGGNTILGGVVAFGAHDAWAVGSFDGANGRRTLILHFSGPERIGH